MINITLLSISLAAMLYGIITHDLQALTIGAAIGVTLNTLYKRSLSGEADKKPIEQPMFRTYIHFGHSNDNTSDS